MKIIMTTLRKLQKPFSCTKLSCYWKSLVNHLIVEIKENFFRWLLRQNENEQKLVF